GHGNSAISQILAVATNAEDWPQAGTCVAGKFCPFCTTRALLAGDPHSSSFVRILRWFEIASGKRWNFRDLFSLCAYLLAGTTELGSKRDYRPCEWAEEQLNPKGVGSGKQEASRARGLF